MEIMNLLLTALVGEDLWGRPQHGTAIGHLRRVWVPLPPFKRLPTAQTKIGDFDKNIFCACGKELWVGCQE